MWLKWSWLWDAMQNQLRMVHLQKMDGSVVAAKLTSVESTMLEVGAKFESDVLGYPSTDTGVSSYPF
jgi:hypothetical protein